MSVQKGDVVLVTIGGVTVGALVSNGHNQLADMLDASNKDTPGIKQFQSGETGWIFTLESLFDPAASEGVSEALGYLKAGTLITVVHGISGTSVQSGSGYISSIDLSGPKNEISSYSLEIQGTGAVSTGYGPLLNISTCENSDYDTFTNATSTGFDAIYSTSGNQDAGTADEISVESGTQYLVEFDLVLNSGTAPIYNITSALGGGNYTAEGWQTSSAGSNSFTFTAASTGTGTLNFRNYSAANIEITNISVREVL